jgi:hypothetical protein
VNSHPVFNKQLIEPDSDQELRPAVKSAKTDTVSEPRCDIGTHRLERFSDWMRLVRTIAFLKRVARLRGTKSNDLSTDVESYQEAEECVLKCVQSEAFGIEIDLIRQGKPLKGSSIRRCVPISHLGSDTVSVFALLTAGRSSWSPSGSISWYSSLFVFSFSQ